MNLFRSSAVAFVAIVAAGCAGGSAPTSPNAPGTALTALPHQLSAAEQSVIEASNAFSFALFDTVSAAQPATNVFLSPLSASMSLGMALNGAADTTYDQMRSALRFGTASQADINAGYRSLLQLLTSLDPGVQMNVANSIWYRSDFPFYKSFLDTATTYFDAEAQALDFNNANASLGIINGWVSDKTDGKIPSIVDAINPTDVMFLINAMYFKAGWRTRFDPALTRDTLFTAANGAQQPVKLMEREGEMDYAQGATYQAVDLPYSDSAYTMTVVLPAPGTSVDALVASLTPAFWSGLTASLHPAKVSLSLPKLTLNYNRQLNTDLGALGMPLAFVRDRADFSRMSSLGHSLYISYVKQNTYLSVDENGTEAAAATVTGVSTTAYEPPTVVSVDRPYLFVIRERLSGTIVFMGKVASMPGA